jgi:outer membrane protein assembly factor BamA
MKRTPLLFLTAFLLLAAAQSAATQTFIPQSIQFKGAPEYSNQELLAAVGYKKGTPIAYSEVKSHTQRLLDTGLFESADFTYNGVSLIFTLVPSTVLYSVRLENLPLTPGKELDAALHDRIPLYHGKAPFDGGLTEQVRQALEAMLAAKGIKATVAATPYTNQKLHEVTAMIYAITNPPVRVGEIHLDAASTPLDPKAMEILSKLTGSAYDVQGTPSQIETYLGNYYHDKGCLEAAVHADTQGAPVIAPEAIQIPFVVSVAPGAIYKLNSIQFDPGVLVSLAELDRHSHIHRGDIADGQHLIENWQFIQSQYRNKGYMEAVVHPTPTFDRTQGTVSFTVTVDPGPVYTMGKLTIQNGADDLRAAMLAAWKLPEGAVFNEGAMMGFYANLPPNSPLARTIANANLKYAIQLNHDAHTVEVTLRMERKQ